MQKHPAITLERVEKFLSNTYWTTINLHGVEYGPRSASAVRLERYSVPGLDRPSFSDVQDCVFTRAAVGDSMGPAWSSHWFKVTITIPAGDEWHDVPLHFLWDSGCEAMIYSTTGVPLQGLTGGSGDDKRHEFLLGSQFKGGDSITLFVEASCNGMFGVGNNGFIQPPDPSRTFTLNKAEIAVFQPIGHQLHSNVTILYDIAKNQPSTVFGKQCLYVANQVVNGFHRNNMCTWRHCLTLTDTILHRPGAVDTSCRGVLYAVGNCHIDTAWLWPFDETRRKVARSWATAVRYAEECPDKPFVFVASQAQQFAWLQRDQPELFGRIQSLISTGRFLPVGGAWVEMDANVPSGESIVKQLLHGQQYFRKWFGVKSEVFWLPDTFGYAPQLPQIIRAAGMKYFLTQKLSWSLINKFPHSSFQWRGLDGSTVLTHFPPADTYNAQISADEVMRSIANNKDADRAPVSMMLYGVADSASPQNTPGKTLCSRKPNKECDSFVPHKRNRN